MGDLNDDLHEMAKRSKREPPLVEIVTDGVLRIPKIGDDVIMRSGEPIRYADTGEQVFGQIYSPHAPNPAMDIQIKKSTPFFTSDQQEVINRERYRLNQEILAAEMAKLKAPELDEKFVTRVDRLVEEARRQGKEEGWNEGLATGRALDGTKLPLPMNPYTVPIGGDSMWVLDNDGMPVPPVHVYDDLDNCVQCGRAHVGSEDTKYTTGCPGAVPLDGTRPTDDPDDWVKRA